jgi:hypothetical protein
MRADMLKAAKANARICAHPVAGSLCHSLPFSQKGVARRAVDVRLLRCSVCRNRGLTARLLCHHEGWFPVPPGFRPSSLVAPSAPGGTAEGLAKCHSHTPVSAGQGAATPESYQLTEAHASSRMRPS